MKRAIKFIAIFVALISAFSLFAVSASAATVDVTGCFVFSEAYVQSSTTSSWLKKTDLEWTYDSTSSVAMPYYSARFGSDLVGAPYSGFRLKFTAKPRQENLLISAGYYSVLTIAVRDNVSTGSYLASEHYFNVGIYDDLGNVYTARTSPSYNTLDSSLTMWTATLVHQVGSGEKTYVNSLLIESDMPSLNTGDDAYGVSLKFDIAETPTEAQRILEEQKKAIDDATNKITDNQDANTDKIIANDDENTDKITGSIEDSTEEITNGWDAPEGDPAGDVNSITDDMGDAENEALGGKSDDEIQSELNGLLSSNSLPSVTSSGMVSDIFNKLLTAFGNEYQAVLMLSLVLGLAAFLVGRSYRAKGD